MELNPRDESRLLGCILALFVPPPSRCCRQEATQVLGKIHKPAAVNSADFHKAPFVFSFFLPFPRTAAEVCRAEGEMKGSHGEGA